MPQRQPDEPADIQEAGGRGALTATGLGGAFVFILVIIFLRGGKKLLVDGLQGDQGREKVASSPDDRFGVSDTHGASAQWGIKLSNLQEILACQKQHGVSDDDLNAVLKDIWNSRNKGAGMRPWQMRMGDMDWRLNVDWDVQEAKRRIEAIAHENAGTEVGATQAIENTTSE